MALDEDLGHSKSEPATPRRREEAREQGRVAYSPDLSMGLIVLAGLGALAYAGPSITADLLDSVRRGLTHCRQVEFGPELVQQIFAGLFSRGLEMLGLLLVLLVVVGLAGSVLQVGFVVNPGLLALNVERLSPTAGWTRIFSLAGFSRGLVALAKIAVVGLVAYWVLRGKGATITGLSGLPLAAGARQAWSVVLQLGMTLAGALLLIGVADYLYRLWHLEKSLQMSFQEVKEELKRDEGDPHIKARIRKLQREAARKRMFQDVPTATVVITNPTHLAVALRYDKSMAAPRVLAKGAGHVAQRIIAIARRHAVPVVERKPLAQALFKVVKVGQEIPATLYYVVAEVLAYVYRLRGLVG